MSLFSDKEIISVWRKNVLPWINAIKNDEITSRVEVTNRFILENILRHNPKKVLDLGCGEGWLTRALSDYDIDTLGIDAVPELVSHGIESGKGRFKVLAYENINDGSITEKFDLVVANFSLIGHTVVDNLFTHIAALLNNDGIFIVQTLHPLFHHGESGYQNGWREGSWSGFSEDFCKPAPWYFRTIESWRSLFEENGFAVTEKSSSPTKNSTNPASIIFTGVLMQKA